MPEATYAPTALSRVRRHPERAAYDDVAVHAVLDAALVAHIGYLIDGRPVVTPSLFWREGRKLYWHGAAASRMLATVSEGAPCSVTVTLVDGLVLAPSGFAHSMNYRSAMAFGRARLLADPAAKRRAVDAFIDRVYPGRAAQLRPPTDAELLRTHFVEMTIEEASAKVRDGGLNRLELDEGWGAWSGVLPVETRIGAPAPDAVLGAAARGLGAPPPMREGMRLDEALSAAAAVADRPLTPA